MRTNKTQNRARGFSLIEVLLAASLIAVAGMAAVAYLTRAAGHADWAGDKVFARQRALSILSEMRAFIEGTDGQVASDLDGFDDGVAFSPSLTIAANPNDPGAFMPPDSPLSGNHQERGQWRWLRQINVRPVPGSEARDLRLCTVRMYRTRPGQQEPGEMMAEVSAVIRTVGESYPASQVFDVYLLALENVPGWWVDMGAMRPFVENTIQDLQVRNPGLEFRTHWITTLGYGRDEEYAPFTNESLPSTDEMPWAYVYPGAMPAGQATTHYYVPSRFRARVNIDGTETPALANPLAEQEPFVDKNGNRKRDPGESFTDLDHDGVWDVGNEAPYALADMHNHCMRQPDAAARFAAREAAGADEELTWRLLLDRMVAEPERFKSAILINLHGELLPMPPTRNVSDAASIPALRPGWRAVTHPERLRPQRGGTGAEDVVLRVHAYKSEFPSGHEAWTTQREPLVDLDGDGVWDDGEVFEDWNGNGVWDAGLPITVAVRGGDFSTAANASTNPSLVIRCLSGGIDPDGDGVRSPYDTAFRAPPAFPEAFADTNGDGRRQLAEAWLDLNGNGRYDAGEPHAERDGDGTWTAADEVLEDANGNDRFDPALPAESFEDANGNGTWDAAEPYWDRNKNGKRDGPSVTLPPTWLPWDTSLFGNPTAEEAYIANFGEPFLDRDGDGRYDAAEAFFDANQNGVCDGGFERGEMWYAVDYDATTDRTIVSLHATPLEAPVVDDRGLPAAWRLYDLEYVPCPTPDSADAGGDRFARHLGTAGDMPKNTARWRITLPVASMRTALASTPGGADGDAVDQRIGIETRIGTDTSTGTMWPVRHEPRNLSTTYVWYADDPEDVPFSERYQMRGDPRLMPYADTDRHGSTAPHGYNWFFDDFTNGTADARGAWLAFDTARLDDRWMGRSDHDVARMMQWLRTGIVRSEVLWTTLTGFSYYYMSVGGDVGADSANGYPNSIPMSARPFGGSGEVYENTITGSGRRFARTNAGTSGGIRSGGAWWSKPFLGELCPDGMYDATWRTWGNLRAAVSSDDSGVRMVTRSQAPTSQLPRGTSFGNSISILSSEGSTSFFNIGSSSSTFHHQHRDGSTGGLVGSGLELGQNYGFEMPMRTPISRPFGLSLSSDGGVGPEFAYDESYPRFRAQLLEPFYDHDVSGVIGSGIVRLQEPGPAPRGGFIVVNGLDRTMESGTSMIARYSLLSLIHGFFEAGVPGTENRIQQIPRVEILSPTLTTEIMDPDSITLKWKAEWLRWDGQPYTASYNASFSEDEDEFAYVLMYSRDNGKTWLNLLTDEAAEPGRLPWIEGTGPDPRLTLDDLTPGPEETWVWNTPAERFPKGSYLLRVECHRRSERNHFAMHMEKIYVDR